MRKAVFLTLLLLAGCGKPQPPAGKWEGGTDTNGTIVVALVTFVQPEKREMIEIVPPAKLQPRSL